MAKRGGSKKNAQITVDLVLNDAPFQQQLKKVAPAAAQAFEQTGLQSMRGPGGSQQFRSSGGQIASMGQAAQMMTQYSPRNAAGRLVGPSGKFLSEASVNAQNLEALKAASRGNIVTRRLEMASGPAAISQQLASRLGVPTGAAPATGIFGQPLAGGPLAGASIRNAISTGQQARAAAVTQARIDEMRGRHEALRAQYGAAREQRVGLANNVRSAAGAMFEGQRVDAARLAEHRAGVLRGTTTGTPVGDYAVLSPGRALAASQQSALGGRLAASAAAVPVTPSAGTMATTSASGSAYGRGAGGVGVSRGAATKAACAVCVECGGGKGGGGGAGGKGGSRGATDETGEGAGAKGGAAAGKKGMSMFDRFSKVVGGVGSLAGSAALMKAAIDTYNDQVEDIHRRSTAAGRDYERDKGRLEADWDTFIGDSREKYRELDKDREKVDRDRKQREIEIQDTAERAALEVADTRKNLDREAARMQMARENQQLDFQKGLQRNDENFAKTMQGLHRQENNTIRDYNRTIEDIQKNAVHREEDAAKNIERYHRDAAATQRDINKEVTRRYRDEAKYEARVQEQRDEGMKRIKKEREDLGLDRAIAGLGMLQAMRQGGLMGILSAWKQWQSLDDKETELGEDEARGGLTKAQQQALDDAREAFNDWKEDIVDKVTDINNNLADRWDDMITALTRGREADVTAITRAGENLQTALDEIKIAGQNAKDVHKQTMDDLIEGDKRFWAQHKLDLETWQQQMDGTDRQIRQIIADRSKEWFASTQAANDELDGIVKREGELNKEMRDALLRHEREKDDMKTRLKDEIASLNHQMKMAEEQRNMALAFNVLFAGFSVTAVKGIAEAFFGKGGAVTGAKEVATTIKGAAAASLVALGPALLVLGVTVLAIAAAAAVIQIVGKILEKITGSDQGLDITKLGDAVGNVVKMIENIDNPAVMDEIRKDPIFGGGKGAFGGFTGGIPDFGASQAAITPPPPAPLQAPGGVYPDATASTRRVGELPGAMTWDEAQKLIVEMNVKIDGSMTPEERKALENSFTDRMTKIISNATAQAKETTK